MEKTNKKQWESPKVESLNVKNMTQTDMRRGRSRQRMNNGKKSQGEPPLAS